MIPVIICGGIGTKMWPESRQKTPKQFLPLIKGKSLFQVNYESLRKKFSPAEIYLQTNATQAEIALSQEPEIPRENVFIEPEMRNQGPATGFAAASLYKLGKADETFMLIQVDDLREPEEELFKMMDVCDRLARETGKYITGGFRPEYVVMGNDFLVKGERVSSENETPVFKVAEFIWRGKKEERAELLNSDRILLHTNHTCMTPRAFLEMFKKYRMEWYTPLMNIAQGGDIGSEYAKMPKGPLEEVTQLVHEAGESLVVELPFKWYDIGTWESTDKYLKMKGWYAPQNVINIDAEDNFVSKPAEKTVAIIGVKNLVVIDTGEALLITPLDQSGRVGEVVERLKTENRSDLL